MFNFGKKKKEEKNMMTGMAYGLGGAVIVVVIVLVVVFVFIKDKDVDPADGGVADANIIAPEMRFTIVTKEDCEDCFDINLVMDALLQAGVKEKGRETLYLGERNADELVEQYNIEKVPALLVSGELEKDERLIPFWQNLGEIIDGVFVLRQVVPPYIVVDSGELKGLASMIYLTDESCDECYDVRFHDSVLVGQFAFSPRDRRAVDVSSDEGEALVEKYDIDLVPTILLRGEVGVYPGVAQIWPEVGEITADGTYIFTSLELMGNHKDLSTGKVVEVDLEAQAAAAATQ